MLANHAYTVQSDLGRKKLLVPAAMVVVRGIASHGIRLPKAPISVLVTQIIIFGNIGNTFMHITVRNRKIDVSLFRSIIS